MTEQHPLHITEDDAEHATPDRAPSRHSRLAALSIAAAVLLTGGAGAWAIASTGTGATATAATGGAGTGSGSQGSGGTSGAQGFSGSSGTSGSGQGSQGFGPQGFGPQGSGPGSQGFGGASGSQGFGQRRGSSSGSSSVDSTAATSAQVEGVVTIVSSLGYQSAASAGTGIVLTSSGRVLTNNHVIDGATSIRVTDVSTGRSYTADVVGTNASQDIAVLQLQGASGLTTADSADSPARTGDAVTAVGNAEGTGTLTAAEGTVTDVDQQITTQSEGNSSGETLQGLIETSADVVSGDSGGPLKDADGAVVGITTAATSGTADITGYAIPISTALSVAERIVAGDDAEGYTIGRPAFLGVSLSRTEVSGGVLVTGALDGTPAAEVGIGQGSVVTAVGGTSVASGEALSRVIASHAPGDRVSVTWTDAAGTQHTATVTLVEGPAD